MLPEVQDSGKQKEGMEDFALWNKHILMADMWNGLKNRVRRAIGLANARKWKNGMDSMKFMKKQGN